MHPRLHLPQLASIDEEELSRRSRPWAVLSRVRNQRQAGIWVFRKSCGGSATMHSTTSPSTMRRRISPSLFWLELMEPLASTTPA